MKTLCIFDLDGTLTDTLSSIAFYCNSALEKSGFSAIQEDNYRYFLGNGRDKLIHRILKFHNADTDENFKKVGADYDKLYESDVICKTTAFDGITDMLGRLKESGVCLAVLSNKPHNVTYAVVKAIFADIFDIVYGQRDNVKLKPDPEGAYIISDEAGVPCESCFFIGDTDNDILTAKNAGMKSIGVLWGFRDREELSGAGADYIVSHPSEIAEIVRKNI